MKEIWDFVRHNSGIVIGSVLCTLCLIWVYGCPSKVTSVVLSPLKVTRPELELEVENFLALAEIRFKDLDQQDEFKRTFFAMGMLLLEGGSLNPAGIALILGNLLGLGAVVDNVRKRTYINTMKGVNSNAEKNSQANK